MRSTAPKKASDETTELNKMLTQGREPTRTEGDRRFETIAAGDASHPPVDVRVVRAGRAGEEKGRGRPFFAGYYRVIVGRGGGSEMDGAEGAGSFNEFD